MDIALFGTTFCLGTFIGLTMKKHGVFVLPQSFGIFMNNREYFDQVQKEA